MLSWINTSGNWVLGIVLAVVGFGLIIVAAFDVFRGAKGETKEWGKIIAGLVIGFIGGLFLVIGAPGVVSFFKKGQEIPHQ